MSNFIIEEVIENSIGRDGEGEPINEVYFTVVSWQGRNFLYQSKFVEEDWQKNRIAECVNGDYKTRFGGIEGWLKHVLKRSENRIDKIEDQMEELTIEKSKLTRLRNEIWECGVG